MKIENGAMVMDQNGDGPGRYGDSLAESSRFDHLQSLVGMPSEIYFEQFVTGTGFVRHPRSIWLEDDMSSDNLMPMFIATRARNDIVCNVIRTRVTKAGYRTGNGDLINPKFLALLKDNKFSLNLTVAAQALIFKIPWRWNDEKKAFESTKDSSGDYLNWIHCAIYCKPWVRRLVSKEVLKTKVRHYYLPEPNSQFILDLYDRVLDLKW